MKSTKNTSGKMLRKVGNDHRTILTNDANRLLFWLSKGICQLEYMLAVTSHQLKIVQSGCIACHVLKRICLLLLLSLNHQWYLYAMSILPMSWTFFVSWWLIAMFLPFASSKMNAQLSQLLVPLLAKAWLFLVLRGL